MLPLPMILPMKWAGIAKTVRIGNVLMNENLTIALDPSSGISLQAQIRQSIVELILNHSILPGDKLPSSRMLSRQLKVSRNTVIFAYQALVDTNIRLDGNLSPGKIE